MAAASASSSSSVRSWRTAFLTLRDENQTLPSPSTVIHLLQHLVFSQSDALIAAAPDLPPHEVTSDMVFLMELARVVLDSGADDDDVVHTFTRLSHLVHNVSNLVSLEVNSSSCALVLKSFGRLVDVFFGRAGKQRAFLENIHVLGAIKECLEIIRRLFGFHHRSSSLLENIDLLHFLLTTVSCSQGYDSLWEVQMIALSMAGEVFSRAGSSLPIDIWQSTIEVLRKVVDAMASKCLLVEQSFMARFYTSLLHCLHLVLANPRGSLSDHVAGFIAALKMFFNYGLSYESHIVFPKKGFNSMALNSNKKESNKLDSGVYRPPHLREKDRRNLQLNDQESVNLLNHEPCTVDHTSSDSDYSDSDGSINDVSGAHYYKARVAAILCIQDLCRADPKLFTAQWTMILPSSDVLQPRKHEATLMSCLLHDPCLKVRIASATTLAAMLDGPASISLQIAEHKESAKCGSFTALSSSLGQILMQLHKGILHLIKHESHGGLLTSLFKILALLVSSTPYSRMPEELLPKVISSLLARIEEGFPSRSDESGLLAIAINCLTAALSASPSLKVKGLVEVQVKASILSSLFQHCKPAKSLSISLEALQALRAVAHNYPDTMPVFWEQISSIVYRFFMLTSIDIPTRSWRGGDGNYVGVIGEKVITAATKVLDESLRAVSGFKGTEDLLDDKLTDSPFTSDCIKVKTISSAPSYGYDNSTITKDRCQTCRSGSEQWCKAIEKHMPLILQHPSAMVRAAAVTCFAGITSFVFFSLPREKQCFIITSCINSARNDEVPSVRSASCRAIGVISCFPSILESAEILDKFIHSVEINARDPLISVRITASWALANICDSLRHCIVSDCFTMQSINSKAGFPLLSFITECALRLTMDNDKIKANAVRALGNISRFVILTRQSGMHEEPNGGVKQSVITKCPENVSTSLTAVPLQHCSLKASNWPERMVQAFLSCVTTGNVKVQWNVCRALSNLFLNNSLKLEDMDWAPSIFSILLLLLRDSSNFKIRIQAAAALAVPVKRADYGGSFSDVVQGVWHVLENLSSDHIPTPSGFKYRVALEKQLTSTMLHVLGLVSGVEHGALLDFLVKKALLLEEWLRLLCSSLEEPAQLDAAHGNQKREIISIAIQSLTKVYGERNHKAIARRFGKLTDIMK